MGDQGPSPDSLVDTTVEFLRSRGFKTCKIALVLGSGLGSFASRLHSPVSVRTDIIPRFPKSTVQGHAGMVHVGVIRKSQRRSQPIIVFQGRLHPYEGGLFGHSSLNVRIAERLGARVLIVTNAAGGLRHVNPPGTIMRHSDIMRLPEPLSKHHLTNQQTAPTRTTAIRYSKPLASLLHRVAGESKIALSSGVYCYLTGPSYETPAEVRMLASIGADAVGMSTYPEVMEAVRLGMEVVGVSLISNYASGLTGEKLDHTHVTEVANSSGARLATLLENYLIKPELEKV